MEIDQISMLIHWEFHDLASRLRPDKTDVLIFSLDHETWTTYQVNFVVRVMAFRCITVEMFISRSVDAVSRTGTIR